MSSIFNLTNYDKVIIKDLSLNGDISLNPFAQVENNVFGHLGPKGLQGPTGPSGDVGNAVSPWNEETNGDIHFNGSLGLGNIPPDIVTGSLNKSSTVPFRAVGTNCEIFVGAEGYFRLAKNSTITVPNSFGPVFGHTADLRDANNNVQPYIHHYFHSNTASVNSQGVDPQILLMGYRSSTQVNWQNNPVGTGDPHNDWLISCYSNGGERRLVFHFCINTSYQMRGYVSTSGSHVQMNFTGQHRTFIKNISHKHADNYEGLIVCADNNTYIDMKSKTPVYGKNAITINDSLPVVSLANKEKDINAFGVISSPEELDIQDGFRYNRHGYFGSVLEKEYGDQRVHINSIGEGGIWVSNKNGILESGDYITTSNIPGYGEKQDSEYLHNYTVAKITMNCDFQPNLQYKKQIKSQEISFTNIDASNNYYEVSSNTLLYTKPFFDNKDNSIDEYKNRNYNLDIDSSKNLIKVRQNILNEHNEMQWEDTNEQEYAYNIRYIDENGNIITKTHYDTMISQGNLVYIAAFVGCTYHCG